MINNVKGGLLDSLFKEQGLEFDSEQAAGVLYRAGMLGRDEQLIDYTEGKYKRGGAETYICPVDIKTDQGERAYIEKCIVTSCGIAQDKCTNMMQNAANLVSKDVPVAEIVCVLPASYVQERLPYSVDEAKRTFGKEHVDDAIAKIGNEDVRTLRKNLGGETMFDAKGQPKVIDYGFDIEIAPQQTGEHTFSILKPGFQACKGAIEAEFVMNGLKIEKSTTIEFDRTRAEEFYGEHKGKPFFDGLVSYMTSGPVTIYQLGGDNAVAKLRQVMGSVDDPNSVRGKYAFDIQKNVLHGSDSVPSAQRELGLFAADLGIESPAADMRPEPPRLKA